MNYLCFVKLRLPLSSSLVVASSMSFQVLGTSLFLSLSFFLDLSKNLSYGSCFFSVKLGVNLREHFFGLCGNEYGSDFPFSLESSCFWIFGYINASSSSRRLTVVSPCPQLSDFCVVLCYTYISQRAYAFISLTSLSLPLLTIFWAFLSNGFWIKSQVAGFSILLDLPITDLHVSLPLLFWVYECGSLS